MVLTTTVAMVTTKVSGKAQNSSHGHTKPLTSRIGSSLWLG